MKIADTSGQDVILDNKKNKRKWVWLSVLSLAVVLSAIWVTPTITNWSSANATINSERLRFATVTRGDFVRDLSVQGKVVAAVSPRLYSTGQGTITFKVDAGDQVKKNQVLAIIDSPELTNKLQQEKSTLLGLQMALEGQKIQAKKAALENQKSVDLAQVALTAADREKRRADKAYKSNTISQIDFEKAQDDLENAKLIYKHAVADAKLNKESLDFEIRNKKVQYQRQALLVNELTRKVNELTLRSPVSGLVGNLAVQQKNQVAQNQPILSVVDLTDLEIEVAIPESYADDLLIGMDAEVTLNGETYPAKLVTISPEIENNQVTGRVRFTTQPPAGLRQNQRLTTRILMEHKSDVLMVQRGQFLESGNGQLAYVLDKEGNMAHKRRIVTGSRSLANVEILKGLKPGDKIIISGIDQFKGADAVLITH